MNPKHHCRGTVVFLVILALLCPAEFLQASTAGAPPQLPQSVWHVLKGGGWIMIPLAVVSIWCLALIIEGFIGIRLQKFIPSGIVHPLRVAFAEQNYQEAWRICRARPSFLSNTLRRALERIGRGRQACEMALSEYTLKESMGFKTKISYLSTIGVISPMVGLLGTVTGMIKAFNSLGTEGIGNPSLLAAAIGEVLIATATGLTVAIPAFFLYYFFRNRLQMVVVLAEDVVNDLMVDVPYENLQGLRVGESMELEIEESQLSPSTALHKI